MKPDIIKIFKKLNFSIIKLVDSVLNKMLSWEKLRQLKRLRQTTISNSQLIELRFNYVKMAVRNEYKCLLLWRAVTAGFTLTDTYIPYSPFLISFGWMNFWRSLEIPFFLKVNHNCNSKSCNQYSGIDLKRGLTR